MKGYSVFWLLPLLRIIYNAYPTFANSLAPVTWWHLFSSIADPSTLSVTLTYFETVGAHIYLKHVSIVSLTLENYMTLVWSWCCWKGHRVTLWACTASQAQGKNSGHTPWGMWWENNPSFLALPSKSLSIHWIGSYLIPAISTMAVVSPELEREEETNQV